ncbi:MAG: transposase [Methylocella sp.]
MGWPKNASVASQASRNSSPAPSAVSEGYDTDAIRAFLKERGIKPVLAGKSNHKKKIRHTKKAYKDRTVAERCVCRLADFRRIATRYDKLAQNFLSALCCAATLAYWI